MTKKKDPKTQAHYVNNKDFTAAVSEYAIAIKEAKESEGTPPQMSEYIGECIYKIATRLSTRPYFITDFLIHKWLFKKTYLFYYQIISKSH